MPYLIVQYAYDPPLSDEQLSKDTAALNPCLEMRGIRHLRSFIATDRRQRFCEAADAETVREAFHTARVKFERVWSADLFGPP